MERIRRIEGGVYLLTCRTTDEDGASLTVTSPEVKVYSGAGDELGIAGVPDASAGRLSYSLPAGTMTALDTYSVVWRGEVSGEPVEYRRRVELVGGFLFEVEDLRAFDPAFADATRYPAALVRAARTAAEERFEKACRQAFVPRGRRARAVGAGVARLEVRDNAVSALLAASIGTAALSADEIAEVDVREWGALDRPPGKVWTAGEPVRVHYEHGLEGPSPEESQAAMLLAREYLTRSNLSSRATLEATDVGFFRLSIAGPEKPTGIPEVDAVIRSVGRHRPMIG